MAGSAPAVALAMPGDWDEPTGGYRYNHALAQGLGELGWSVSRVNLTTSLPHPKTADRREVEEQLANRPDGEALIIDGLALCALGPEIERRARQRPVVALLHHPLSDGLDLDAATAERFYIHELQALSACQAVLVPSAYIGRRTQERHGVPPDRIFVAPPSIPPGAQVPPGLATDRPPTSQATEEADLPCHLLCVGALSPRKGQDLLITALAQAATTRPWHLHLVGLDDKKPAYVAGLKRQIAEWGLDACVTCHGAVSNDSLVAFYAQSDLAVQPSRYEGYGMAVQEALAAGLPVVATDGGALADTANEPGCRQVPADDAAALRAALAELIDDPGARQSLAAAARGLRGRWPAWSSAAAVAARALAAATTRFGQPARSRGDWG